MISDLKASEIMTKNIFFYDPEDKDFCRQFCRRRNIDFLPVKEKSKLMEFKDPGFEERNLTSNLEFSPDSKLLSPELVGAFHQKPTRFALKDGEFVGVIHFSDYNDEAVYTEAYKLLYHVEQKLRYILEDRHLENAVKERVRNNEDENFAPLSKSKIRGVLKNAFKFSEELEIDFFSEHEKDDTVEEIVNFRNRVMHAKEFVSLENESKRDMHYDRESFFNFVNTARKIEELGQQLDYEVDGIPEDSISLIRLS